MPTAEEHAARHRDAIAAKAEEHRRRLEEERRAKGEAAIREPYGDVEYADPGYQPDATKRYPLDTEAHIRNAWSRIHEIRDEQKYTPAQRAKIEHAIVKAWEEKIDPAGPPEAMPAEGEPKPAVGRQPPDLIRGTDPRGREHREERHETEQPREIPHEEQHEDRGEDRRPRHHRISHKWL